MTPIISIVGLSGSGKTTYIEKLIAELKKRGYRVASIKHAQEIHFEAGKDSERHLAAGSEAVVVAAPNRVVMIKRIDPDYSVQEALKILGDDFDLILAEGFKQADTVKIVLTRESYELPLDSLKRVAALATDKKRPDGVRQFFIDDIKGVADFLEQGFIKPQLERLSVYVNGKPVELISFPRKMIAGTIKGMISSLKGVKKLNKIQVWLSTGESKAKQ